MGKYADNCFDKFCPSLQKVDKNGKSTIQKRTCWKCGKYHSTIKAMKMHKRTCEGESDDGESEEREDGENEEDYAQIQFIDDNDVDIIGDNEAFEIIY